MKSIATALFLAVTLAACGDSITHPDDGSGNRAETIADLAENRAVWARSGPRNYTFVLRTLCFCAPPTNEPVRITVRDRQLVSAVRVSTGQPVTGDELTRLFSIDGLFERISDAIGENAYRIDARYEPRLGYPVEVYIDYDDHVADEEQRWEVSELQSIQ